MLERYDLSDQNVILTVARISKDDEYKGHRKVIAALQDVRRNHPNTVYVVVGSGDNLAGLKLSAIEHGVSAAVRFLGQLPDSEVRSLYHACDAFVMPSTKEGFGIVFLEAAACGLPVIAGNRDGSVDALAEGALGTLIDPVDAPQLVTAICAALDARTPELVRAVSTRFGVQNFNAHVDDLVRSFH